jgi:hypothetical protein
LQYCEVAIAVLLQTYLIEASSRSRSLLLSIYEARSMFWAAGDTTRRKPRKFVVRKLK